MSSFTMCAWRVSIWQIITGYSLLVPNAFRGKWFSLVAGKMSVGCDDDLPEKVLEKVDMGVHIHAGACVSVRVCGKVRAGERGPLVYIILSGAL